MRVQRSARKREMTGRAAGTMGDRSEIVTSAVDMTAQTAPHEKVLGQLLNGFRVCVGRQLRHQGLFAGIEGNAEGFSNKHDVAG